MDDDSDSDHRGLVGWILGIAVAIAITVALTSGVVATMGAKPAATAAAPATAPATAAMSAPAMAPAPAMASAPPMAPAAAAGLPVAKVYFASGEKAVPADVAATLAPIVDAAKAQGERTLVVSGFHDRTGNPELNAELAKQRAFAVRDALVAAGVVESRIELRRPEQTEGDGNDREARRVEVSLR